MVTLAKFVRHAERFGAESVYETAEFHLTPGQRASLAGHLRRIDRTWKLGAEERRRLIDDLTAEGTTDQKLGEALGVSRRAAYSARAEYAQATPANPLDKPEKSAVFAASTTSPTHAENFTPHGSGEWQSWVYGGASIRHAGTRRRR